MNTEILSYGEHNKAFTFLKTINYPKEIIDLVVTNVLPEINNKNDFLDIGGESGKITFPLSKYFTKTMAFEPNPSFVESYEKEKIALFQRHFDPTILNHKFNLILASHVFYYIDIHLWSKFIDDIKSLLDDNGFGVITITAPTRPILNMHETFNNGHYTVSTPIINDLKENSTNNLNVYRSKEYDLKMSTFEDALTVYNFIIFANCFSPEQQNKMTLSDWKSFSPKIEKFIETTRDNNGLYHFIWSDDIIVFSK